MLLKDFCKACGFGIIDLIVCGVSIEFEPSEYESTDFSSLTAYPDKLIVARFCGVINEPNVLCVLAK